MRIPDGPKQLEGRVRSVLSRRAVASALAAASLVGSRGLASLLSALGDTVDVTVVGVLFYQSVLDSGVVGQQLSWVLLGFLVYAYGPSNVSFYGPVADDRGFATLTAVLVTYFGLGFGLYGGFIRPAVVFGLVPTGQQAPFSMLLWGLFGGVVSYLLYFRVVVEEPVVAPESDLFEIFDSFTVEDQTRLFDRIEALPGPLRVPVRMTSAVGFVAVFVLFDLLVGLGLAISNQFYPVPELLVVGGLVATAVVSRTGLSLPYGEAFDLELQSLRRVTGAFENLKGSILAMYSIAGLLTAGLVFLFGIAIAGVVAQQAAAIVDVLPAEPVGVAGLLWFFVGLVSIVLLYALFGLLYWLRQLQRLPPYVRYWEQRWLTGPPDPLRTSVSRPPGLFGPGNLILVTVAALLRLSPGGGFPTAVVAGFGVAWPALVAFVGWSAHRGWAGTPQPLLGEGRDVVVALLAQFGTVVLLGSVSADLPPDLVASLPVIPALVILLYYLPDVFIHAERREGRRSYLDAVYVTAVFGVSAYGFERLVGLPAILYVVGVGLAVLLVVYNYLERRFVA